MKKLRILCCTWNVGDSGSPGEDLTSLLGLDETPLYIPDVICVAFQEVVKDETWTADLKKAAFPKGYVLVKVRNIWAIWIYVFAKREHLPAINNLESEITASGYAGIMGNKGGATIRMDLYGVNIAAVCAHFTPHMDLVKDRINDYVDIISSQKFRDPDVEVILDHDYVFWMGDLNFRLEGTTKEAIEEKIQSGRLEELMPCDQLLKCIQEALIFCDFQEAPLTFPPTYKFDPGTEVYDTSKKQRCPSWTDRVLYLVHKNDCPPPRVHPSSKQACAGKQPDALKVQTLKYTSLPQYRSSDHRPVIALYEVTVHEDPSPLPVQFTAPVTRDQKDEETGVWSTQEDGEFSYVIRPEWDAKFHLDSRDWIGLYRSNFTDVFTEYLTWVYVPSSSEKKADREGLSTHIDKKYLREFAGQKVVLAYFSRRKNCAQGYSPVFKIRNKT